MSKKKVSAGPMNLAHLIGYDSRGEVVIEVRLDLSDYYEELHPLIDEETFRESRGIIRVTGTLYDSSGAKTQDFENRYDKNGKIVSGIAHHSDGTVIKMPD